MKTPLGIYPVDDLSDGMLKHTRRTINIDDTENVSVGLTTYGDSFIITNHLGTPQVKGKVRPSFGFSLLCNESCGLGIDVLKWKWVRGMSNAF